MFYEYNGNDIRSVYGVKVDKIVLAFYKNRLYQIQVAFGTSYREYLEKEYTLVDDVLRANFGNNVHNCMEVPSNQKLNCIIWDGQNVRLEHVRYDFSEKVRTESELNRIVGHFLFTYKPVESLQKRSELEN